MLFSVVSRSCWPEIHLTGSVQNEPAPTLAGMRSDPSNRNTVALYNTSLAIFRIVSFGYSETSKVLCGERLPTDAALIPWSLLAMKLRSLMVLESLLNAAARSPPPRTTLSPTVFGGKKDTHTVASRLASTESGKPPLAATKVACLNRKQPGGCSKIALPPVW